MSNLISRQAAIDAMKQSVCGDTWEVDKAIEAVERVPSAQPEPIKVSVDHEMTEEELKELKKKIADSPVILLPSAQPEPHEGHWIPVHPIQSDDPGAYMCSKCKTGMWEIRPSAYHYCPNCGAKMDLKK